MSLDIGVRIAAHIVVEMVFEPHHHGSHAGGREAAAAQESARGQSGVTTHLLPFLGIQRPGLVQDIRRHLKRHLKLTGIVEERGQTQLSQLRLAQTEALAQHHRKHGHVGGVGDEIAIEILDGRERHQGPRVAQDLVDYRLGDVTHTADVGGFSGPRGLPHLVAHLHGGRISLHRGDGLGLTSPHDHVHLHPV